MKKPSRWLIWAKCTMSELSPRSSGPQLAEGADWISSMLPSARRARGAAPAPATENSASSPSAARKPPASVAISGL